LDRSKTVHFPLNKTREEEKRAGGRKEEKKNTINAPKVGTGDKKSQNPGKFAELRRFIFPRVRRKRGRKNEESSPSMVSMRWKKKKSSSGEITS